MDTILSHNSRTCFVCHRATQLKLEGVESLLNTTVGSEGTITTLEAVYKEY